MRKNLLKARVVFNEPLTFLRRLTFEITPIKYASFTLGVKL